MQSICFYYQSDEKSRESGKVGLLLSMQLLWIAAKANNTDHNNLICFVYVKHPIRKSLQVCLTHISYFGGEHLWEFRYFIDSVRKFSKELLTKTLGLLLIPHSSSIKIYFSLIGEFYPLHLRG